jgi:hypothetical protein
MQPNEITLTVDETNDGVTTADVDHVFRRLEEFQNRTTYIQSANHALDSRDMLNLYRTAPRPNGNFRGVSKSSLKFTKDIDVLGLDGVATIKAPIIVEVNFSIPIGATNAEVLLERQKVVACLDDDSIMGPLNTLLEI